MPRVWLSLGSNIERERQIRSAVAILRARFGRLVVSRVFESEAVGFTGAPFYNLVVGIDTELPPGELVDLLHGIETAQGRSREEHGLVSRTLDIDLLTYGDTVLREGRLELPREEILRYAFVLRPLAEVAGEERHPLTGESYGELWAAFDQQSQPLWPVDLAL